MQAANSNKSAWSSSLSKIKSSKNHSWITIFVNNIINILFLEEEITFNSSKSLTRARSPLGSFDFKLGDKLLVLLCKVISPSKDWVNFPSNLTINLQGKNYTLEEISNTTYNNFSTTTNRNDWKTEKKNTLNLQISIELWIGRLAVYQGCWSRWRSPKLMGRLDLAASQSFSVPFFRLLLGQIVVFILLLLIILRATNRMFLTRVEEIFVTVGGELRTTLS